MRTSDPHPEPDGPPADVAIGWYALALTAYVALGLTLRTAALNWIVGPLFLVLVLHVLPAALRHVRAAALRHAPSVVLRRQAPVRSMGRWS